LAKEKTWTLISMGNRQQAIGKRKVVDFDFNGQWATGNWQKKCRELCLQEAIDNMQISLLSQ